MLLADLIADAVARPGYGGGLSREELARMVKRHPYQDKWFTWALSYAYRQHKIDFCMGYIVKPPVKHVPSGLDAWLSTDPVPMPEAQPPWLLM